MQKTANAKVILLILDGWGHRESSDHNAIRMSNPENYDKLLAEDPHLLLDASGESVGLPAGQMGNSEVGHTNLGAGRIVYQDLLRISRAFKNNVDLPVLSAFFDRAKRASGRVHLLGLLSDGGVHSHIEHFKSIVTRAKVAGIEEIYIHPFTDGRDTLPTSGINFAADLKKWTEDNNAGVITDLSGRFYAMDRDKRWDRIEEAYGMLCYRQAPEVDDVVTAIQSSYDKGKTDEFIKPFVIKNTDGGIKDGDSIIFMNFRADRMREIMSVFYKDNFAEFNTGKKPTLDILTMTEYDATMPTEVIFPTQIIDNQLGKIISKAGLKQLRIAETEKYAHVTFFFNGGSEEALKGEERILVPSPRDVPTYDLKPEMSVREVTKRFEERFMKGDISFAVMNFANPDMVGHTGVEESAVRACKCVDEMIGQVRDVADRTGSTLIIVSDHGNSEEMWDYEHGQPHTMHTTNPVNMIIHNLKGASLSSSRGKLADVAPTVLKIMSIAIPPEMTGDVLII